MPQVLKSQWTQCVIVLCNALFLLNSGTVNLDTTETNTTEMLCFIKACKDMQKTCFKKTYCIAVAPASSEVTTFGTIHLCMASMQGVMTCDDDEWCTHSLHWVLRLCLCLFQYVSLGSSWIHWEITLAHCPILPLHVLWSTCDGEGPFHPGSRCRKDAPQCFALRFPTLLALVRREAFASKDLQLGATVCHGQFDHGKAWFATKKSA